jgi:hypothetical protein
VLRGGAGTDELNGGRGRDVFEYASAADSAPGSGDTIFGFRPGQDEIDFSALPGRLLFVGEATFTAGDPPRRQSRSRRTRLRSVKWGAGAAAVRFPAAAQKAKSSW